MTNQTKPPHTAAPLKPLISARVGQEREAVMEDCMELEHVVGYAGHFRNTCLFHPIENDRIIYSIGAVVVVGDRKDPHNQRFLQGHDAEISALTISRDGKYVATGQLGSTVHAGNASPVLVWDCETLRNIYVFEGLQHQVSALAFSPDGRFLAATSRENCVVWDMEVGEVVVTKLLKAAITLVTWGRISKDSQSFRPMYQLNLACSSQVIVNHLVYNVAYVRYVLETELCTMPTGGLVRNYTTSLVPLPGGTFLLAGTSNGEFCVFNIDHKIFRTSVPVASNGVLTLCCDVDATGEGTTVYVGSGDGSIKQVTGHDSSWRIVQQTSVAGRVMSLSLRADRKALLAGTDQGRMYEITLPTFSVQPMASSHVDSINAVAFTRVLTSSEVPRSDFFCTASNDGTLLLWDLSNYSATLRIVEASNALCVSMVQRDAKTLVFSGWQDAFIRVYDAEDGKLAFNIRDAHKGAVTAISVASKYFLSGGACGTVRVWSWSRELLCQFSEHKKAVSTVLADVRIPHELHSCGLDGLALTYDLRTERRTVSHFQRRRMFHSMAQREDSEQELLTVTSNGQVLAWDCDEKDPVMAWADSDDALRTIALSSSGRYLATAGDACLVKVYELYTQDGRQLHPPELIGIGDGHFAPILGMSWAPDEKQLVSVADNCSICVWNFYGSDFS